MTKKQVINFVKSELSCGNCILVAPLGNGGSDADLVSNKQFVEYLDSLDFVGKVAPADGLACSKYFEPSSYTYQFNGLNGSYLQIQIF